MENIIIKAFPGNDFTQVAKKALELATSSGRTVEFDFNERTCLVNAQTNLDWLYRDYQNSWLMDWKQIGPDCLEQYTPEIQTEFENRTKAAEEKAAIQSAEYAKQDAIERTAFAEKIAGIELELASPELWESGKAKNTDPYGACIYEYAEGWAKLMQAEIAKGKTLLECAEATSFQLGFLGITGFMYGAAVSILSACWVHGESLRKWHNKEYGHEGDGVVNSAVLTISM